MSVNNGISPIERHFQTGIQVVIIGILLWFGNKTIATSDTVIRLEEQMLAIRAEFKAMAADRYTAPEARAQHSIIDHRVESIERRVEALENGS